MKGKKWLIFALTLLFMCGSMAMGSYAWADNGDGSGGGKNNPLVIESTIPANGATGVENLEYIIITFNKNVVYMTVRDHNMQCFSLWLGDQRIPAEIIMADDQIEREKRHDVLIKPLQPLQPGATYRVEIAPEVQSKSGVNLGKKTSISFTMAPAPNTSSTSSPEPNQQPVAADIASSEATAAENEKMDNEPDENKAAESIAQVANTSAQQEDKDNLNQDPENNAEGTDAKVGLIIGIILGIIAVAIIVKLIKSKK